MTMNESPPPPPPPTALPMKRFKFVWRFLLLSNLGLGAFLFARAKRRDSMEIHRKKTAHRLPKAKVEVPPELPTSSADLTYDDFLFPVPMPVEARAPIPEEQQREVFEWMLEEKRKVKPKDAMEKKQIDEEKYILKQFLRAKSIPKF